MIEELLHYTKYVAAPDPGAAEQAAKHFRTAGMRTQRFNKVEALELAKLAETTYFGVLIAFAQEINRLAEQVGGDYQEVTEFFREVDFLPSTDYFPGFIGGHCVIPNIKLLKTIRSSPLFEAVLKSNQLRATELAMVDASAGRARNRSNVTVHRASGVGAVTEAADTSDHR
jgi:UDP-glucose 6-dehydrogenase